MDPTPCTDKTQTKKRPPPSGRNIFCNINKHRTIWLGAVLWSWEVFGRSVGIFVIIIVIVIISVVVKYQQKRISP